MCNPCLSTSEISGASDTSLMENVERRNELIPLFIIKNHARGAGQVKIRISLP